MIRPLVAMCALLVICSCEKEMKIVCVPSALTATERQRSAVLRAEIGRAVKQVKEVEGGYLFVPRDDANVFAAISEWVPMERKCCPFLSFEVQWKAGEVQPTLRLTGPKGTKEFLKAEMPELLAE